MNKHIDLSIEETKEKIFEAINSGELSLGMIKMIIDDVHKVVNAQYEIHIKSIKEEYNNSLISIEQEEC